MITVLDVADQSPQTWDRIPTEIQSLAQWCACDPKNKAPIDPKTGQPAATNNPTTWGTFEQACAFASSRGWWIGFVFCASNGFAFIDVDHEKDVPLYDFEKELRKRVIAAFSGTYAERSASGRGLHFIAKTRAPFTDGKKKFHVEVYADRRFCVFTGKCVNGAQITDQTDSIGSLHAYLTKHEKSSCELPGTNNPEIDSDDSIFERAEKWSNYDRFKALFFDGDLSRNHNDHSRADEALIWLLCALVTNNGKQDLAGSQVRRLFLKSALGQRPKAHRADYIDRSIKNWLAQTASEKPVYQCPVEQIAARLRELKCNGKYIIPRQPPRVEVVPAALSAADVDLLSAEAAKIEAAITDNKRAAATPKSEAFSIFPPGFIGRLARHFLERSFRTTPQACVLAALGLMAGIAGRAYVSPTGLGPAVYLVYVAESGRGKESIKTCIEDMGKHCVGDGRVKITQYHGRRFASGQGFIRDVTEKKAFVSVVPEFGLLLKTIGSPSASGADKAFLMNLLDMYGQNRAGAVFKGVAYSKKENDVAECEMPGVSLIGETTGASFFDALEDSDAESGLLGRFVVVEYSGEVPSANRACYGLPVPEELLTTLSKTAQQASREGPPFRVPFEPRAAKLIADFGETCMRFSGIRQAIFNRAETNATKIAMLVAIGNDPDFNPHKGNRVTYEDALWATQLVFRSCEALASRFSDGDVGTGEDKQRAQLEATLRKYRTASARFARDADRKLRDNGCISYRWIAQQVLGVSCFKKAKYGPGNALKAAIESAIRCGQLVRINDARKKELFDKGCGRIQGDVFELERD